MYEFRVYCLLVKQSSTLYSIPLTISSTPNGTTHSYYNIIDYIFMFYLLPHDWFVTTNFLKLFFIDHVITVVPNFPPLSPSTQHLLPQAIPTSLFVSLSKEFKFSGYSVSYTVLYIPIAILELPIYTS